VASQITPSLRATADQNHTGATATPALAPTVLATATAQPAAKPIDPALAVELQRILNQIGGY